MVHTAGIDTVLATTLGTAVAPKTFSTGHLHQAGLSYLPNGNGNGNANGTPHHNHLNVGNGTTLNHTHVHPNSNGNSHSGSIGNNSSTHSLTPHGHGPTSWNNRTSICSAHNKSPRDGIHMLLAECANLGRPARTIEY
uniref:Uncharacterized protein n=1 Tax=Anopheles atroparvus TaxID=41427 RepID=A0A182IX11_ANOAO